LLLWVGKNKLVCGKDAENRAFSELWKKKSKSEQQTKREEKRKEGEKRERQRSELKNIVEDKKNKRNQKQSTGDHAFPNLDKS